MTINLYELIQEPMPNWDKIEYTFLHRKAFRFVLDSLLIDHPMYDELDYRADVHDLDKVLYLALGGGRELASGYHRAHADHHMETNDNPSECDMLEAIIDYECAGFTKKDKPLNAYDTVIEWNKPHGNELIELMEVLGIARSYENTPDDPEWLSYLAGYEPSEDEVMKELDWFCQCESDIAEDVIEEVLDEE